jgi:membrane-associated phospholipid phosphatase
MRVRALLILVSWPGLATSQGAFPSATSPELAGAVASTPASAAAAAPSPSDGAALTRDTWRAAGITAGALVLDVVVAKTATTTGCRWCGAGTIDQKVRDALVWSHPADASQASDILANVLIPALAAADAVRATSSWGNAGRDALVVAEAASLNSFATTVAKYGFARRRPGVPVGDTSANGNHSFWSGHTSMAFSIAVAQAMQDTMREDPAAPWVWAVGLTLATTVGYLRIGADAHWFTDVLAGAATGSAFGVGIPLIEKRLVHGVTIAPAPGGVALRF